jgi:hypothetical protein
LALGFDSLVVANLMANRATEEEGPAVFGTGYQDFYIEKDLRAVERAV